MAVFTDGRQVFRGDLPQIHQHFIGLLRRGDRTGQTAVDTGIHHRRTAEQALDLDGFGVADVIDQQFQCDHLPFPGGRGGPAEFGGIDPEIEHEYPIRRR